ncbi:hypothetical protein PTKIN_Ptkin16aG0532000 [Pterospermum kingtungense]
MEAKEVLFMNKGEGETSYVKRSKYTQKVAAITQPIVYKAAQSVIAEDFCCQQVVNVADLGCSCGPNTFTVISTVIESMVERCSYLKCQVPEIQFYLNDLVGNDFNTLFKGLSDLQEKYKHVTWFAMGAPGGLFPRNTLHLVHSSYSVHWLSKGLIDEEKLDFFNVPYYTPYHEEVQSMVDHEGSFTTEFIDTVAIETGDQNVWSGPESRAKGIRAFTEPMVSQQFGEGVMNKLYDKVLEILVEDFKQGEQSTKGVSIVVILKKEKEPK